MERTDEVRHLLESTGRRKVVELTEHVMIEDYARLRAAVRALGEDVQVAVDDAAASFASMRHILEL